VTGDAPNPHPNPRPRLVVVGHGMVGHRFLEELVARKAHDRWAITVFGDEPVPAYDRVHLSAVFDGTEPGDLSLMADGFAARHGIEVVTGEEVIEIDTRHRTVMTSSGRTVPYDHLVLATGSAPFIPPVPGHDRPGTFAYRTLDDLAAIRAHAEQPRVRSGVVVGGGLLGLEAANALRLLGLDVHVVEMAPRLMPVQLDDGASATLRAQVEALGIRVHTDVRTTALTGDDPDDPSAGVCTLEREDDDPIPADIVVFSAGIRPRDQLARDAGIATGDRGGVVVDGRLATSDPHVSAIGEVAAVEGRCLGLVAPGYEMARTLAARLAGEDPAPFTSPDLSTKLKLLGVDVASFGDAFATTDGALELVYSDAVAGVYKKLVVSGDGTRLLGGILVGDASAYGILRPMVSSGIALPDNPEELILPAGRGGGATGVQALPDDAQVCSCNNVSKGEITGALDEHDCEDVAAVKKCTGAGTTCGSCVGTVKAIVEDHFARAGKEVSRALCEHFGLSRSELFEVVAIHGHRTFDEIVEAHGTGRGCDVCKPAVASILASQLNGHVLAPENATLQDTNDAYLANIQRNGTYSVVPRIPGGEITPEKLIVIGEVARDFGLYTKITGGQRIDLFGARMEQLPEIWKRLVDAGFESGHAYGKSLRTVKSCVGSTWCRYGVQDSVGMAIALELRYRGLRSPHKLKGGVSGCARECAEARSKDFGIIATEKGWNLYVGGNGGATPVHARLLAGDLDDETLVRYLDRYLMYYIRTADRLQRTSTWIASLDGGLDRVREVVVDDALGLGAELEAEMARHVDTYFDEWAATLDDPDKLRRFVSFVNAPETPDPTIAFTTEREQIRPVIAGADLPVGAPAASGAAR